MPCENQIRQLAAPKQFMEVVGAVYRQGLRTSPHGRGALRGNVGVRTLLSPRLLLSWSTAMGGHRIGRSVVPTDGNHGQRTLDSLTPKRRAPQSWLVSSLSGREAYFVSFYARTLWDDS
jgi:hypothetical protein